MKKNQSKNERIKQLEAQLSDKERKIANLEDQIAAYDIKFEDMRKMLACKPEDCVIGEYCQACSFSKHYFIRNTRTGDFEQVWLCNKAGSYVHFVQREE